MNNRNLNRTESVIFFLSFLLAAVVFGWELSQPGPALPSLTPLMLLLPTGYLIGLAVRGQPAAADASVPATAPGARAGRRLQAVSSAH